MDQAVFYTLEILHVQKGRAWTVLAGIVAECRGELEVLVANLSRVFLPRNSCELKTCWKDYNYIDLMLGRDFLPVLLLVFKVVWKKGCNLKITGDWCNFQ